jgi:transcriptional regulator GlxA family with amidase domain
VAFNSSSAIASSWFTMALGTVARKWGFGHYGRFAAEYARRFGRKPSETLRTQR